MRRFSMGSCALLLMSVAAYAQPALFSNSDKTAGPAARNAQSGTRDRHMAADANVLQGSDTVAFNLFDDRSFNVHKTRTSSDDSATVWSGEIDGTVGSEVTVIIQGGQMTGSI